MLEHNGHIVSVVKYLGEPVGSRDEGKAEGLDEGYQNGYADAKEEFEPNGTVDIVTNGQHDVSKYAVANVNVPMPEYKDGNEVAY